MVSIFPQDIIQGKGLRIKVDFLYSAPSVAVDNFNFIVLPHLILAKARARIRWATTFEHPWMIPGLSTATTGPPCNIIHYHILTQQNSDMVSNHFTKVCVCVVCVWCVCVVYVSCVCGVSRSSAVFTTWCTNI